MRPSRTRAFVTLALSASLASPPAHAAVAADDPDASALHALKRLTFGPLPGDIEHVRRMGLERWVEQQLHPERIQDDALPKRLAALETIQLSTQQVLKGYDPPPQLKREIQKRRAEMPEASEAEQRRAQQELRAKYAGSMAGSPREVEAELQAAKLIRAVHSERQLDELLVDFWMNHFNVYAQKGPVRFLLNEYEQQVVRPRAWGKFEDLLVATAKSPAMLFYLDNWLSVDPKSAERMAEGRQRGRTGGAGFAGGSGGRRGAFGSGMRGARRPPQRQQQPGEAGAQPPAGRRSGLNENYARELMELHTLGVDGGYTQQDVTEVARAFTGWTIKGLRQNDPEFAFEQRVHDTGSKQVLGQSIKNDGQKEGLRILHMLATHPSTAHFISYKLARRFVSDEPPAALVQRAADTFLRSAGDIREVLRTIVTSPEFYAAEHREAKLKTPLEFVVSAVRAAGGTVTDGRDLARRLGEMGMPLYLQQPPTGYKDTAEAWVSTSGLLARLNFALELAEGRVRGVSVDPALATPGNQAALVARLVPAGLSDGTLETLQKEAKSESGLTPSRMAGLILGSPEFQRR